MFQRLIGGRKQAETTSMQLVNSNMATFTPWSGKVYDNDIARSAIWTIAEAAGKADFVHCRGEGESMQTNPDPVIRMLMEQPNEYLTMQDLIEKMVIHLEKYNNAFALINRDYRGKPVALYPLDFASTELRESRDHELYCRFRFRGFRVLEVPYADIIHIRKHFDDDEFYGQSNANALSGIMEVINTTDQGLINAVKNSAIISWIMKFTQTLKPEALMEQIKKFSEAYLNTANNGTGVAAADGKYDLTQVKHESFVPNAVQMDRSKQRLHAYYGVNDKIVQKTYTEEEWNAWYEGKIEPILMKFAKQFTMKIFSPKERAFGNRIYPESSSLQYASISTKLALWQMVDRGAMLPNEWRRALNLPPLAGGDKPIRRLDTQTVDSQTKPNSQTSANLDSGKDKKPGKEAETMTEEEKRAQQQKAGRQDWQFEMRAADNATDGQQIVEGRAIVYDSPTLMYEYEGIKYYEVIARGALDGADISDVPMRYNHSQSFMIVARHNSARPNRSSMEFLLDNDGLTIRADLSKTESGRQLHEAIQAGLIDKMSFAFNVSKESYNKDTHTRTIEQIKKLWDVSAVDTPAYDTTSIYARDRFQAEAEGEKAAAAEAAERRTKAIALDIDTTLMIYGGMNQ